MSLIHSPKIVTDGLVLCIDAANPKSYTGTGTEWNDLSRSRNTGVITENVTFTTDNGGAMILGGVSSYAAITNSPTIRPDQELTIEVIIKGTPPGGSIWSPIIGYGNGAYTQGNYLVWATPTSLQSLCRIINNSGVTEYRQNSTVPLAVDEYKHMCFTMKIGDAIRSYHNGIQVGQTISLPAGGEFYYAATVSPYQVGGSGSGWLTATIPLVRLYNRVLSTDEIYQNFMTTRIRFGL